MSVVIPPRLLAACDISVERQRWLEELPRIIATLQQSWSLTVESSSPYRGASCSWVAPAQRQDGLRAVLKIGLPHMEARDEAPGLRFWNGNPTIRLIEVAESHNAMLLERCEPGTALRQLPEPEQDEILAAIFKRLWRKPKPGFGFRPLADMTTFWAKETRSQSRHWQDAGLVREGLHLLEELSRPSADDVLLATDLHAGNVLSATRMPWLAIDPKPFVGDPAYDATQHLMNCRARVQAEPQTIKRLADMLEVDEERVRLWLFARVAAEPRAEWDDGSGELAAFLSHKAAWA